MGIIYILPWMLKKINKCHERLENIFPTMTTHGKCSWSQNQQSVYMVSTTEQVLGAPVTEYFIKVYFLKFSNAVAHINHLNMKYLLLNYIIGKQCHSVTPIFLMYISAPTVLDISCIILDNSMEKNLWRKITL